MDGENRGKKKMGKFLFLGLVCLNGVKFVKLEDQILLEDHIGNYFYNLHRNFQLNHKSQGELSLLNINQGELSLLSIKNGRVLLINIHKGTFTSIFNYNLMQNSEFINKDEEFLFSNFRYTLLLNSDKKDEINKAKNVKMKEESLKLELESDMLNSRELTNEELEKIISIPSHAIKKNSKELSNEELEKIVSFPSHAIKKLNAVENYDTLFNKKQLPTLDYYDDYKPFLNKSNHANISSFPATLSIVCFCCVIIPLALLGYKHRVNDNNNNNEVKI